MNSWFYLLATSSGVEVGLVRDEVEDAVPVPHHLARDGHPFGGLQNLPVRVYAENTRYSYQNMVGKNMVPQNMKGKNMAAQTIS